MRVRASMHICIVYNVEVVAQYSHTYTHTHAQTDTQQTHSRSYIFVATFPTRAGEYNLPPGARNYICPPFPNLISIL